MRTWTNRIGMAATAAAAVTGAEGFAAAPAPGTAGQAGPVAAQETGPAFGQHLHRAEPAGACSGPVRGRAG